MALIETHKKQKLAHSTDVSSTSPVQVYGHTTSTGPSISERVYALKTGVSDQIAALAIENHLKFLRSAGRTTVTTEEVARSLSLPLAQVERIALVVRGVKVGK